MTGLDEMRSFWSGKSVLVTGHTGFKGSWLSLWLDMLQAKLAGYSLAPPTTPSLFELAGIGGKMASHIADIRDLTRLVSVMEERRPEIVFHLAAQALVRESYRDPIETFSSNVMGTLNVLEAARKVGGVRAIVIVTSDKCYGGAAGRAHVEEDAMGGHDPYSSSKGCAELLTAAYRHSFFDIARGSATAVASARAGNVIGGGDWAKDRLIPDCIRAFSAGEKPVIRYPDAVRPWQHVLEPVGGYILLARRLHEKPAEFAEGWNFGPAGGDARPVRWVVQRMADAWGDGASWRLDAAPQPPEAAYLNLDCSKAARRLGWRARLTLEESIDWTLRWHKGLRDGAKAYDLTRRQIEDYCSRKDRGALSVERGAKGNIAAADRQPPAPQP